MKSLYDTDAYTWAMTQAEALRRRSSNEIDWENVAEEIESVGRSQASELYSRYVVLVAHLLKWRFQPERRSRSWENTIRIQRLQIARHMGENPGLKPRQEELFAEAYPVAQLTAANETDLPVEAFPEANPFSVAQATDEGFWPDAAGGAK